MDAFQFQVLATLLAANLLGIANMTFRGVPIRKTHKRTTHQRTINEHNSSQFSNAPMSSNKEMVMMVHKQKLTSLELMKLWCLSRRGIQKRLLILIAEGKVEKHREGRKIIYSFK